jgi:L-arabinose isomerase
MGNHFRLLVNEVEAKDPSHALPKLPVARVLWKPLPDLKTACTAWIYAGGAHHTVYSQNLTTEYFNDFAKMANIEFIKIDKNTELDRFENELKWNEMFYLLNK